jgi:predicted nucleic acid-binding protein
MTRVALDSNILAYFAGVDRSKHDHAKIERVRNLIDSLSQISLIAPVQALGELFVVLLKAGATASEAREVAARFAEGFLTPASNAKTAIAATDLVVDHKLQFWDALIVTAAAEADCTLLLSEDMQHGFVTRGLTIINPFADPPHRQLSDLLPAK